MPFGLLAFTTHLTGVQHVCFNQCTVFQVGRFSLVCTQKLLEVLPTAPSQLRVVSPSSVGLEAIGHVGAFRRAVEVALWLMLDDVVHSAI